MTREQKARKIREQIVILANQDKALSPNEIRVILALERIVSRLTNHPTLEKHLVYKGGFVLLKTLGSQRFTRDLDALGSHLEKSEFEKLVPEALEADLDDGFWYGDIRIKSLDEQGEYGALRFDCAYQIGDPPIKKEAIKKLSRIHFDVGFGDAIPKNLKRSEMSSLLKDSSATSWRVYPPEFIFSEKLQTLVQRASTNSRAKDVHDMGILFDQCDLKKLSDAISQTFKKRETEMPTSFLEYVNDLDTRVLESGWAGVKLLPGEDVSFLQAWKILKKHLAKIDAALS